MTDAEKRLPWILAAVDDSTEARAAAIAAIRIARNQNLAIQGLYVADESLALDTYAFYRAELPLQPKGSDGNRREPTSRAELMSWLKAQGETALNWLETECAEAGVPVTIQMLAGGVPEMLVREASRARMLAIGRRGHGHKNALKSLGHNFRKIAHQVHRPILVGGLKTSSLRRLLLAYHGQGHADAALDWTLQLQRDLAAEVIVLCVGENNQSGSSGMSLEAIRDRLAQSDLNAYRLLTSRGKPSSEIAAIASANDVDLIILGSYRHAALVEWLVGSTVDRLLQATSLPMLIA
jgi:nucleotide-binding universal stress UspA family protein